METSRKNEFFTNFNHLNIQIGPWRDSNTDTANVSGIAPVNIGKWFCWRNLDDITIKMSDFQKVIFKPQPKMLLVPYTGQITLDIPRIGKVKMTMHKDVDTTPQLAIWSDSSDYTFVGFAFDHPNQFATDAGCYLTSHDVSKEMTYSETTEKDGEHFLRLDRYLIINTSFQLQFFKN